MITDKFAEKFFDLFVATLPKMFPCKTLVRSSPQKNNRFETQNSIHAVVPFFGQAHGAYLVEMSWDTAARLISQDPEVELELPALDDELREDVVDGLAELINIVAGKAVASVSDVFSNTILLAPQIHIGYTRLPAVPVISCQVDTPHGVLHCHFYMDNMKTTLSSAYDTVVKSLEDECRKLEQANAVLHDTQKTMLSQEKLVALGQMAAGVGHEINNPLAVISGQSKRMKKIIGNELSEEKDNHELALPLETINRNIARIVKIIQGLRSFSRDSAGDPLVATNIKECLDDTLGFSAGFIKEAGIDLKVKVADDLIVNGRAVQISQVLLNLLNNARDALSEIEADEKWIKVEAVQNEQSITIHVIDSGKGIPKDIQVSILNPFFTTKEQGKGTGLGLSISADILKSHGGSLSIDEASPNTCFVLKFPRMSL
ncbi:MAG: GHKL domain-containing protein [Bdellovibrionaceae bacterium]|jgi:C4-dicarboxylate-specific signal transduction histidine kinase|nr:GHKL domain-containing protein [Pseudobdellovibrionaceae bacterium]